MLSGRNFFALIALLVLASGSIACGGGADPAEEQASQNAEEWAWLQQTKTELDAKRAELAEMKMAERAAEDAEGAEDDAEDAEDAEGEDVGGGEEGTEEDGADAAAEPTEAPPTVEEMTAEVDRISKEYNERLAAFINSQEIYEGEPLTDIQRAAFDLKGDEDILIAQEFIDKAGDYQRAIDIYLTSLAFDPENEKLAAAKAEAEAMRYMTEERFAMVKKGMTEDEVRATLGTPMRANVREFENGIVGWFYPKEVPNTAAAVFFQMKDDVLESYKTDFEAVKAQTEETEQG